MAASTLTFAQLKTRCEDLLDLDDSTSDLNDATVTIGVSDYLQYYQTEEMAYIPTKWSKEETITVGATGYELSGITDLWGTKRGFKVYLSSVLPQNRLFEVKEKSYRVGYYIKDATLFLNVGGDTTTSQTVVIKYYKKPTRYVASTQEMDATVIPIEQGAERGVELFVCSRYLERDQADPQRAVNMRNDALREIPIVFSTSKTVVGFSSSPVVF